MASGTVTAISAAGRAVGLREDDESPGWLGRFVARRMRRSLARAHAKRLAGAYEGIVPTTYARSLVRWACVKAAVSGALSGLASTAAALVTAETEGMAGVVALPSALAAILGEMAVRGIVHVDLACELAEVFEVHFDGERDLTRLFTLVFGRHEEAESKHDDLGKALLHKVAGEDTGELMERASNFLVGESVLRNLIPFVGIASSAITNVVVTYRLGSTLRRTFRYERAIVDAMREGNQSCAAVLDLLIEGIWFVFAADGRLSSEETACLAQRLDDLPEPTREAVMKRFTRDESDWLSRLGAVPVELRDAFLNVLEVAAAVDKSMGLPEEKILERVAHAFGREHDPSRVAKMIASLDDTGLVG